MDLLQTVIIAIVEGLTEFLPVSSTGHMIIAQGLLGVESTPFVKAFTVIIQFGAILSVICLYWRRFSIPKPFFQERLTGRQCMISMPALLSVFCRQLCWAWLSMTLLSRILAMLLSLP